jgi:hypothetical protein
MSKSTARRQMSTGGLYQLSQVLPWLLKGCSHLGIRKPSGLEEGHQGDS